MSPNYTHLTDLSEKAQSQGYALALPTNFYSLQHADQLRVLSDAYTTLIDNYGGVA